MKFIVACSRFVLCWALLVCAEVSAAESQSKAVDLHEACIVLGKRASAMEKLAASELRRYLAIVAKPPSIVSFPDQPGGGFSCEIVLGTPDSSGQVRRFLQEKPMRLAELGGEGFAIVSDRAAKRPIVYLCANRPVGVLYGTYALLEHVGFGFFLGGDAIPPDPDLRFEKIHIRQKPVFAVRGSLPWFNFLDSPTTWDLRDFQYFFEQMAKQRFNFVGLHSYDYEPFCAYEWQGKLVGGEPLRSSLNYNWGAVRGMGTAAFLFGGGAYYDRDPFASESLLSAKDRDGQIRASQELLAKAFAFAKTRGIHVCLGFELRGDPTNPQTQKRLRARIAALLRKYPMLDAIWFWQSEGLGQGGDVPSAASPAGCAVQYYREHFAYLKNERRIAEACRVAQFASLAYRITRRFRQDIEIIVSGWGGDRWLRFSDFYKGLDEVLPKDVVFAALDNIDPTAEPNVSHVYGELSKDRRCWPIPWWESDGGGTRRDQWGPQCNVKPFVALCADAYRKKCDGLLAIHWRTRDVEEVAAYQARFSWNPKLTYTDFYRGFARACFGKQSASKMAKILMELESLGPRWTGSLGQVECGHFSWFSSNDRPKAKNLATLAAIRNELARIRDEMVRKKTLRGVERIEWLITTIDWLTRYDKAALALQPGGPVQTLIAQMEKEKASKHANEARKTAALAWRALANSGFGDAVRTYPRKMSTMGEWGTFATIQVKACATYQLYANRIAAVLGGMLDQHLHDGPVAPGAPVLLVGRIPPGSVYRGEDLPVHVVAVSGKPVESVTLFFRPIGETAWRTIPMKRFFRDTQTATIPSNAIGVDGVQYYVEAKDAGGHIARWPKGAPQVTWSAIVVPRPRLGASRRPRAPAAHVSAFQAKDIGNYRVALTWKDTGPPRAAEYVVYGSKGEQRPASEQQLLAVSLGPPVFHVPAQPGKWFYRLCLRRGETVRELASTSAVVPEPPPPPVPESVKATAYPGENLVTWKAVPGGPFGYKVFRREPGMTEFDLLAGGPSYTQTALADGDVRGGAAYEYAVAAVDIGGQEGPRSAPVTVRAVKTRREPVFHVSFDGSLDAVVPGGARVRGAAHAPARLSKGRRGKALDTRAGGYVTYPHQPSFDPFGAFSVTFWLKIDSTAVMPVLLDCGEWGKNGWFVQVFGNRVRFYIGRGNVVDAGRVQAGRWTFIAVVSDSRTMSVYQDGRLVGSRAIHGIDLTPWRGPLIVGHYHFLTPEYQTRGLIDDLKIYRRVLSAEEIKSAWKTRK